jgi:hypothetical protein
MIDFFPMLKHHRSTLFDFIPILKHQSSTVLHPHQLFHSSLLLKHPPFTIIRQQDFTLSNVRTVGPRHNQKPPPQQHHHKQA